MVVWYCRTSIKELLVSIWAAWITLLLVFVNVDGILGCNQDFKEAENAVSAAAAKGDPISEFPAFRTYNRNGKTCNRLSMFTCM